MTQSSAATPLPRILCLHGGGSNSTIFNIQTRKLQAALRDDFEFVFAQAPFRSQPGPGIYPVFEGAGPFFRWHFDDAAGKTLDPSAERRVLRDRLTGYLVDDDDGDDGDDGIVGGRGGSGGEFVGVMGFSQGARVATGLLMSMVKETERWLRVGARLKFAVLICGTFPPMLVTDIPPLLESPDVASTPNSGSDAGPAPAVNGGTGPSPPELQHPSGDSNSGPSNSGPNDQDTQPSSEREYEKLNVPSVHVLGLQDPWLPEGKSLVKQCYESACAKVLFFQAGHHVPHMQEDIDTIARAVRGAWAKARQSG